MPNPMPLRRTVITREVETITEEQHGPSSVTGPRIRCPKCEWKPASNDEWTCHCGHSWNTFDTGGVCPGCLHQWPDTQCLSCHAWSAHSDWYEY